MPIIKKLFLSFGFCCLLLAALIFSGHLAFADSSLLESQTGLSNIGMIAYGGAVPTDIRVTIARIIQIVLEFLGVIFIGLTVFAGFQYMTAAGNDEQTKKAISLLRNAVIGLIIILASWAITTFIIMKLANAVDYYNFHL